jgi:large subunit ribosomal protein L23
MAQLHDILIRPLITEKGSKLQESENLYVFRVAYDANKLQVKDAVERLFGVRVADVRTVRVRGKIKRFGRFLGKRSNWKKAYVKLREGDKLDLLQPAEK